MECAEGNFANSCNGCLPEGIQDESEFYYWLTEGGCGQPVIVGGMLDDFLDFLLMDARPQAEAVITARYLILIE